MLKQRKVTENGAIRRIICGICSAASLLLHHAPAVAALVFAGFSAAAEPSAGFNDGIDRSDPNFVKASLLVMSPGDELYSCAGHSCIRLECPKFNLDYCFSYESESVKDKIFTFFMGKLKMGMFALPIAEYLKTAKDEGRGVMQYTLNLPPDAKQRLWKILDDRVAQGANLPYDCIERGCAQADFNILREALKPYELSIGAWPKRFESLTRREFVASATMDYPWQQFILYALCGIKTDTVVGKYKSVVIPRDLLEILSIARVGGKPVIDAKGIALLPVGNNWTTRPICTPFMVSWLVLGIAVFNFIVKWNWLDWVFLALQSLLGLFFTYALSFSNLVVMGFNVLIVPFNLLPLVFWKWRKKWALWFAGVLMLWEIGMIAYPHRLTDPAYLVLVGAYVLMYARIGWKWNRAAIVHRTAEPAGGRVSSRAAAEGGRKC